MASDMFDLPAPVEEKWSSDLNSKLACPDCKIYPPNLIEDYSAGDVICGDCGNVLGARIIDSRSEWRTFANDESGGDDPSRVGKAQGAFEDGPQLETGLSIGEGAHSRELTRAHNKIVQGKGNKALHDGFAQIAAYCQALPVEDRVTNTAKHFWMLCTKAPKVWKNKNTDAVLAACVFQACRQLSVPRSFKEIHNVTLVSKKEIGKMQRTMDNFINGLRSQGVDTNTQMMGVPSIAGLAVGNTTSNANDFAERFGSMLNLPDHVSLLAKAIIAKVDGLPMLDGRSPLTVAASTIYFASSLCGVDKHPKEFAVACGVSDGTIRTTYKALKLSFDANEWKLDDTWYKPPYNADPSKLPAVSIKQDSTTKQENSKKA